MPGRSFLRLLATVAPAADPVPDADLLRRFARERDSAAFELVVRRHAGAVWAACRRVLRSEADAEDAFQAAFLVLARKAGAVRGPCAGGWLHRVAVNAAVRLKANRDREGAGDVRAHPLPHGRGSPEGAVELAELSAIVQEELARLPERYRLPVVLCDLEGHTHAEAATALGWPVGSVSGRLSRARAILRDRLTRRGVAPAALVGALIAVAPPASAMHAAASIAAGSLIPSPAVTLLTQGVLTAMRTAKLKLAAVVASAGLLGLAGTGTVLAWGRAVPPVATVVAPASEPLRIVAAPVPPEKPLEGDWLGKPPSAFPHIKLPDDPAEIDYAKLCPNLFGKDAITIEPTDDTYRRLQKARLRQGAEYFIRFLARVEAGAYQPVEFFNFIQVMNDMRQVTTELWANDPKALVARLEEFVLLAKIAERFTEARTLAGTDPPQQINQARAYRLGVEAALWKVIHPRPERK